MSFKKTPQTNIISCRGIESVSLNDTQIIVNTPIEKVLEFFNKSYQIVNVRKDVYGSKVVLTDLCFLIYQFKNHSWTAIRIENVESFDNCLKANDAQIISQFLNTQSIYYNVNETETSIRYHLYRYGNSIEEFHHYTSYEDISEDIVEVQKFYLFKSKERDIQLEDMKNEFEFVNSFLLSLDAYIAPIDSISIRGKSGAIVTINIVGFEREDFERVDYIAC